MMIPKIKMSFLLTEQKKMNENVLRKDFFMFFKPGKLTPKTDLGQSGWFGGLNWMSCSTGT